MSIHLQSARRSVAVARSYSQELGTKLIERQRDPTYPHPIIFAAQVAREAREHDAALAEAVCWFVAWMMETT